MCPSGKNATAPRLMLEILQEINSCQRCSMRIVLPVLLELLMLTQSWGCARCVPAVISVIRLLQHGTQVLAFQQQTVGHAVPEELDPQKWRHQQLCAWNAQLEKNLPRQLQQLLPRAQTAPRENFRRLEVRVVQSATLVNIKIKRVKLDVKTAFLESFKKHEAKRAPSVIQECIEMTITT